MFLSGLKMTDLYIKSLYNSTHPVGFFSQKVKRERSSLGGDYQESMTKCPWTGGSLHLERSAKREQSRSRSAVTAGVCFLKPRPFQVP